MDYPLKVVEIPDINDLVEGKNNLNILKNFSIEDIADRSIIDTVNISENFFKSKTVLVTGGEGQLAAFLQKRLLLKIQRNLF